MIGVAQVINKAHHSIEQTFTATDEKVIKNETFVIIFINILRAKHKVFFFLAETGCGYQNVFNFID